MDGDDLDEIRAGVNLTADLRHHLLRGGHCGAEVAGVAVGHLDDSVGTAEARSKDDAALGTEFHLVVDMVLVPHVPHGGHALAQAVQGIAHGQHGLRGHVVRKGNVAEAAPEGNVGVGVDEAGHDHLPCAVNGLGTGELAGAGAILVHSQHGSDLAAVHQ